MPTPIDMESAILPDPPSPTRQEEFVALRDAFTKNPEGYQENRNLALYLFGVRGYQIAAEPYVLKALSHGIEDAQRENLLFHLAAIHTMKGETGDALEVYSRLHAAYPNNPFYSFYVGETTFRLGRVDEWQNQPIND